jgi:gliding-associated putative ABC transporter substrate-binding component GldG
VKSGANAIAQLLFVVGILTAVNIVAVRFFGRLDLTEDKVYTLSQASKDLAKNLPDRIVVKAFISKDQPARLAQIGRYVRDLLDEYKAASGGKFQWEAIDPADDKKHEEEATRLQIPKLRLQEIEKEKVAVKSTYMGVSFEYGDKTDKIPQIGAAEGLEYQVSSIIRRLTVKKKKIGFVSGFGCADVQNGLRAVQSGLTDYDVVPITMGTEVTRIGDDVDAIIVYGPKQPLSEAAKREIDRFLMTGRSVAFFVDGMTLDTPQGQPPMPGQPQPPKFAKKNDHGLEAMFASYGFKVSEDMVADEQNVQAPAVINGQLYFVNQPMYPVATDVNTTHRTTEKIKGIIFPFSSSVELVGDLKDGKAPGKAVALARSSAKAWHLTGFFLYDPQQEIKQKEGAERSVFTFGYAYEGKLPSAFNKTAASSEPGLLAESEKPVRMIVMGDSDFAHDETLQRGRQAMQANWMFMLNVCDWLLADEALIAVRGKTLQARPLTVKSESAPMMARYANAIGLPLAFCLFGVIRWRSRKSRRASETLND